MKIEFDPKADAFLIKVADGRVSRDEEIGPNIFAGYDRKGNLIEIQILEVSNRERPWVTLEAAAKYLEKSTRTIERWIKDGTVSAEKIGREYHIPVVELKRLKASGE